MGPGVCNAAVLDLTSVDAAATAVAIVVTVEVGAVVVEMRRT